MRPEPPNRQQISVNPVAGLSVRRPLSKQVEGFSNPYHMSGYPRRRLPKVPVFFGDAPRLGILGNEVLVLLRRRARRKAQHHWATSLLDRLGNLPDPCWMEGMVADTTQLDIVHTPVRIKLHDRVVVGLPG